MDSLSKQFKSLKFTSFFKGFKKGGNHGAAAQTLNLWPSNTGSNQAHISKSGNSSPIDISCLAVREQTATMSAEQFAAAVGLEVESFTDIQPELSVLSVIASKNNIVTPVTCTSIQSNAATSPVGISSSFPKLDMNMFIPPPGYQAPPSQYTGLESIIRPPSADLLQKRRASEASYFHTSRSHQRTPSTPEFKVINEVRVESDGGSDDVQIRKKGRFTMKVERSAHWTASKRRRRRTSSRFSLTSATSSSDLQQQDVPMGDLELTRQDTFESVFSVASSTMSTMESNESTVVDNDFSCLSNNTPSLSYSSQAKTFRDKTTADDRRDSGVDSV